MAFPTKGWPPPVPSGRRSLRFFATGTATGNFSDNAFLFAAGGGATGDNGSANPFTPLPYVEPGTQDQVDIGKTPQGSGQDARDVDPSYALNPADQPVPTPAIFSFGILIANDGGGDLAYSFDGTHVHGVVKASEFVHVYNYRHEAGIAVRGAAAVFRIVAW